MKRKEDGTSRENQKRSPGRDTEISSCMQELDSLKTGAGAVAKLIACGCLAIKPLRQFLLTGEPGVVYQTRRWAVDALAGLGARDVLLEYLKQERDIPDPAVWMGEEAVKSAAAQKLVRWPSEEVIQVLIGIAQERFLPGALEVLGELKILPAVPLLVAALKDDFCRSPAEEALRKIGLPAAPALIQVAITPYPNRESEEPSSLLARRSAVDLLAEVDVSQEQWGILRPLLDEADERILITMSRIAAKVEKVKDQTKLFRRLITGLQDADWYVKGEIENALVDGYGTIGKRIEEEIVRRQMLQPEENPDPVLSALINVQHRAAQRK